MPSEFIQRQIDRLLEQASEALQRFDWPMVRQGAEAVLGLDGANLDALALLNLAQERLTSGGPETGPATGPGVASGPMPADEARAEGPTSFVSGRYRVEELLGEGGKKRVYRCHDTMLDRDVAFALIKTEGLDDEGRQRITREAQAMGKLGTHPHIVSVFDIGIEGSPTSPSPPPSPTPIKGEGTQGTPYLVTELMAGGDVEGLLESAPEHRLALEDAVSLAVQVCRGLEFAHNFGVVHRDLKPGNVWLTAEPSTGSGRTVAKLGDFGLAVALDRSRFTKAGMMVGTVY